MLFKQLLLLLYVYSGVWFYVCMFWAVSACADMCWCQFSRCPCRGMQKQISQHWGLGLFCLSLKIWFTELQLSAAPNMPMSLSTVPPLCMFLLYFSFLCSSASIQAVQYGSGTVLKVWKKIDGETGEVWKKGKVTGIGFAGLGFISLWGVLCVGWIDGKG